MNRKNISTILMSFLLLSSPIFLTQCSLFKGANKVASSINNISDLITKYDNQAKHYIDVVTKAKKGDLKAIAESAELLGKVKNYKKVNQKGIQIVNFSLLISVISKVVIYGILSQWGRSFL